MESIPYQDGTYRKINCSFCWIVFYYRHATSVLSVWNLEFQAPFQNPPLALGVAVLLELYSPNPTLSAPNSSPSHGAVLFKLHPWGSPPEVSPCLGLLKTMPTGYIRPSAHICHAIPLPPSGGSPRSALFCSLNLNLLISFDCLITSSEVK